MAKLKFCGAAGTVTGSCSLIETPSSRFLIDCGLFQGNRTTQQLNYEEFPFDPATPEFLILTHAHIDHSGLLPKLTKAGFSGPIYATRPTTDLLEFMLRDSGWIQENNVERVNKRRRRQGLGEVDPIYTVQDAEQTLQQLQPVHYEQWFQPAAGIDVRMWNAGHLLGSASAEIKMDEGDSAIRVLFSGDLGPEEKAFHPEPDAPVGYDYIVCESTYGNRERDDYTLERRREALRDELTRGLDRGGNVIIPSFAVERSQELLHDIGVLLQTGEIPKATVYLDSPLARRVTQVFIKYSHTLEDVEVDEAEIFRHPNFHLVESVDESKAINNVQKSAIIISASGMCNAGRIKHHLKNNIWRKEATVLFVGYQAPGTLGHIITSGAKRVRIHGKDYKVAAQIRRLGNYSAHADQSELIEWIMERGPFAGGLFLNHGDDDARSKLRELLGEKGLDTDRIFAPLFDESFDLVAGAAVSAGAPEPRIDQTQIQRDWYNDYADFMLRLDELLETTQDDKARKALIGKLVSAMEE